MFSEMILTDGVNLLDITDGAHTIMHRLCITRMEKD